MKKNKSSSEKNIEIESLIDNPLSGEQISLGILRTETEQATSYRNKSRELQDKIFEFKRLAEKNSDEGLPLLKECMIDNVKLLESMMEYESNLVNHEILFFFYADIARTALNSRIFDLAVIYAKSGIEANESVGDREGVLVNKRVLLDVAVFSNSCNEAIKIIEDNPELNDSGLVDLLKNKSSTGDENFKELIASNKRPKSLEICLDEDLMKDERPIRALMKQMGIGRKEALKYKEMALSLFD